MYKGHLTDVRQASKLLKLGQIPVTGCYRLMNFRNPNDILDKEKVVAKIQLKYLS